MSAGVRRAHSGRFHIVCVVEGEGEIKAVQTLVRRSVELVQIDLAVRVTPIQESRGAFQKQHEVEKIIKAALIQLQQPGGVLLLFDSDGDCPGVLGPRVLGWARGVAKGTRVGVVIAHQEYEAWLLAGANTLGRVARLRPGLRAQENPEAIARAKERLSSFMPAGESYSPTRHQEILTARFDLGEARKRAPSFGKWMREIESIITASQADEEKGDKSQ